MTIKNHMKKTIDYTTNASFQMIGRGLFGLSSLAMALSGCGKSLGPGNDLAQLVQRNSIREKYQEKIDMGDKGAVLNNAVLAVDYDVFDQPFQQKLRVFYDRDALVKGSGPMPILGFIWEATLVDKTGDLGNHTARLELTDLNADGQEIEFGSHKEFIGNRTNLTREERQRIYQGFTQAFKKYLGHRDAKELHKDIMQMWETGSYGK